MNDILAIVENQENLYTLDPYMTKNSTNEKQREKMKKFLTASIELTLTKKQRQVIKMYYLDNKNLTEIADILEVNKSTVQRTLKAAVKKLKKNGKIFEKSCL